MSDKQSQSSGVRTGPLNLILFGPAGAGKGTQAAFLANRFSLLHLSTGDLLRSERKAGTALGRMADELMSRGELVPDEVVGGIVRREAGRAVKRGQGILFDGYPRNMHQFSDLEGMLRELNSELAFGVSFEVNESRLLERLTARRTCEKCRKVFNLRTKPPKVADVCDVCGGRLYQRSDDKPEVILKRLKDYQRQCQPLLDELDRRGRLKRLQADNAIEEVRGELTRLIEQGTDEIAVH